MGHSNYLLAAFTAQVHLEIRGGGAISSTRSLIIFVRARPRRTPTTCCD